MQRIHRQLNATWRPLSWMQNEGTVGVDLASSNYFQLCRTERVPAAERDGAHRQRHRQPTATTATSRRRSSSTSTWNAKPWMNLKTTVGADYTNLETDFVNSTGTGPAAGRDDGGRGAHDQRDANSSRRRRRRSASTCRSRRRSATGCSSRSRRAPTRTARSARTSSACSTRRRACRGSCPTSRSSRSIRLARISSACARRTAQRRAAGPHAGPRDVRARHRADRRSQLDDAAPTRRADARSNPGNPNLKPERSAEFESGLRDAACSATASTSTTRTTTRRRTTR